MPELPVWFQVELPAHLTWGGDPGFWRGALVAEFRKSDPTAFTGRNLLRPFGARHTQQGVVLDLIMMLVDVPRERVVIAAFPSFIGPTMGAGVPFPSDEQMLAMRSGAPMPGVMCVEGADQGARDNAAATEAQVLADFGLRDLSIQGPDGNGWRIVLDEFDARSEDVLGDDGHSLTPLGVAKIEHLVRGTVSAASTWVTQDAATPPVVLQIEVAGLSPVAGPTLQQSLARSSSLEAGSAPAKKFTRVEIYGSTQGTFMNNPTVKAYWNGRVVGELKSLGGHLLFDIESAGELRLKAGLRSATVQVRAEGTVLYLGWDRTWGRLLASQEPHARF